MVMDNIESDTNEVFYGGKTYKRVPADLKRGFTMKKQKLRTVEEAKTTNAATNIAPFQDMLHDKAKFLQNNTDEYDEPIKPDLDVFQMI